MKTTESFQNITKKTAKIDSKKQTAHPNAIGDLDGEKCEYKLPNFAIYVSNSVNNSASQPIWRRLRR